MLHKENGDLGLAEMLYAECLATRRTLLGNSHPSTILSVNNLGTVLFERGRLAEVPRRMSLIAHSTHPKLPLLSSQKSGCDLIASGLQVNFERMAD